MGADEAVARGDGGQRSARSESGCGRWEERDGALRLIPCGAGDHQVTVRELRNPAATEFVSAVVVSNSVVIGIVGRAVVGARTLPPGSYAGRRPCEAVARRDDTADARRSTADSHGATIVIPVGTDDGIAAVCKGIYAVFATDLVAAIVVVRVGVSVECIRGDV